MARAPSDDLDSNEEASSTAAKVLHASEPYSEVRAVVGDVVNDLAHDSGHRIAALYASADP